MNKKYEKKTESSDSRQKRTKLVLQMMGDKAYVPMKKKELALFLCNSEEDKIELGEILAQLLADGLVIRTKREKYTIAGQDHTCVGTGTYINSKDGYGFICRENGDDLYVAPGEKNGAFHQDTVEYVVLPKKGKGRAEARVMRVCSRGLKQVVGTYEPSGNGGFVICDERKIGSDIYIPAGKARHAQRRDKVVVRITSYGNPSEKGKKKSPEGIVTNVLGAAHDPGVDMDSLVYGYGFREKFTIEQQEEAKQQCGRPVEAEADRRKDLRGWTIITIDGEDARDLDDGVSLTMDGENYILGVHIADVSHYVAEGSALDRGALERGTSVYFPDRVIPMLPRELSNGICSLNEGEDRLALSCIMTFDRKGKLLEHELSETIIRVSKRMTYTAVASVLEAVGIYDGDSPIPAEDEMTDTAAAAVETVDNGSYMPYVELFCQMARLSRILRRDRRKRGAVDFHFPEAKIILNESGAVIDIVAYGDNVATRLIEDFMLAANETVAEEYFWRDIPFLYRIHEEPDRDRLRELAHMAAGFGCRLHIGEHMHPKMIQRLLQDAEDKECDALLGRLALRSMQKACYAADDRGHFGLAADHYTHFTSPIRRYPDLQIHRIIKETLRGRMNESRREHYAAILEEVAAQASRTERRSAEAEREAIKRKKALYMSEKIGEIYDGVISGVTGWGIYVQLDNTVEGLVHVGSLRGDYFVYDEETYSLTGEKTGCVYSIGMPIRVRVSGADPRLGEIDFEPVKE